MPATSITRGRLGATLTLFTSFVLLLNHTNVQRRNASVKHFIQPSIEDVFAFNSSSGRNIALPFGHPDHSFKFSPRIRRALDYQPRYVKEYNCMRPSKLLSKVLLRGIPALSSRNGISRTAGPGRMSQKAGFRCFGKTLSGAWSRSKRSGEGTLHHLR